VNTFYIIIYLLTYLRYFCASTRVVENYSIPIWSRVLGTALQRTIDGRDAAATSKTCVMQLSTGYIAIPSMTYCTLFHCCLLQCGHFSSLSTNETGIEQYVTACAEATCKLLYEVMGQGTGPRGSSKGGPDRPTSWNAIQVD